MKKEKIDRINALARASKQRALTEEEAAEQKELRNEYLAEVRASFAADLDNTVVQRPDGTRVPLANWKKKS